MPIVKEVRESQYSWFGKRPVRGISLEIFDFTVNALRGLETELDRLVNGLADATQEQLAKIQELREKFAKIEEKMKGLEKETEQLKSTILSFSTKTAVEQDKRDVLPMENGYGALVSLECRRWEEFRDFACQAQILAFEYKEAEQKFRVSALKTNQVITYEGELPNLHTLLRAWLSEQVKTASNSENMFLATGPIDFQQRKTKSISAI